MKSPITYAVDNDLDDAALWAMIDSAAATATTRSTAIAAAVKHTKALTVKHSPTIPFPISSPQSTLPKNPRKHSHPDGEVLDSESKKIARFNSPPMAMVKHKPVYSSPLETRSSVTEYCYRNNSNSPIGFDCSPVTTVSTERRDDRSGGIMRHSLSGQFPTVSLFKEYQDAAMAILEKSDYTLISGSPYIKKSGWRKISFYFNVSYEIKDKTIEFDDNRNVVRAEFVVRAYMQGGRFSDGWGSCERREKKFQKPNNDIPSTAETRAKNRACQDLLGIGEYRPGASHSR